MEGITARSGAPLPPTGTTSAADTITTTGARLKGTVNPNGASVSTCRFDYGTTTEYGQTIACSTTRTGTSPSPVSAEVSGLSGETTYRYRLVVITDNGTATGNDMSFTTTPPAVPPTGSTAEFLRIRLYRPILERLGSDQPDVRGELVAAQLAGLRVARYVLCFEPLASAPRSQIVAGVAPSVQRYLTGRLDTA